MKVIKWRVSGLDQPGFLHYTSFLLPWDVVLRSDRDGWPTAMSGKKYKQKKMHKCTHENSVLLTLVDTFKGHNLCVRNISS